MPHLFTVEEAEALLPQLIPLVTRMQELKTRYDSLMESATAQSEKVRTNGHPPAAEATIDRQALESLTNEMNEVIEEISGFGCEVKDLGMGLLDFRSIQGGREVNLCWKLGEPRIDWWHDLDRGFASREPLERT